MGKTTAIVSLLVFVILATISSTSARPTKSHALSRQKRQSDQRLAELETLLALQKYGRHRFRMDRKKGVGAEAEHPPGYGIIDFRMLGRKKKSTRFSPGELDNSVKKIPFAAEERPSNFQESQPNPYWTSENNNIDSKEDSIADAEHSAPHHPEGQQPSADQIGDLDQQGAVPLFYLRNKK